MNNVILTPKGTVVGRAVHLNKIYSSILFRIITFCFWFIGVVSILGIPLHYLGIYKESDQILGFMFVASGLILLYAAYRNFYFSKERSPINLPLKTLSEKLKAGEQVNLFSFFSFELARSTETLFSSQKQITNKELLTALLSSTEMYFVLARLGIRATDLLAFQEAVPVPIMDIFISALDIAVSLNHSVIEVADVFSASCLKIKEITTILNEIKIAPDDIVNIDYWQTQIRERGKKSRGFFNPERLKLSGGIGKDWAYGWTPFLKQFSVDLSKNISEVGLGLEIIGHDPEIKQIKEALLKQNGGNVIIVGEAGVGKNTTVLGFAKEVVEGGTNSTLDFKHIIKVDTNYLLSGATSGGELTNRLHGLLSEAGTAGNIIIYFEDFQNLVSSGGAGQIDATEILLPFLDQTGVHVIATCDVESYNKFIAQNSALNERLTRITIEEPTNEEMIRILEDVVPVIEYKTKSIISYEAIKEAIVAANKYILNLPNPEKSINLIDGATSRAVSERSKTIVLPKDVDDYVSEKYEVPVGDLEESEKAKLLSLEGEMHKSVIGQAEAISAIANALRRVRAGVVDSKKPIGSFLFLGPTGVGKTETAKALARCYFGAEDKMLRFDMSEYQNKEDIYRLLGSNLTGENQLGLLTTAVREHPFSLVLFDEIEKAHPDILDLFLQMLDEGFITDGTGRKVSFTNTIIISTSNAGANLIRESIQGGVQYEKIKESLLDYLQKQNLFRPEFHNRFTGIVAFSPLSLEEIEQVAGLMIVKMIKIIAQNKGVSVSVDPAAVKKLATLGFDPQMGARPMERVIEEKLENYLATKLLSGELKNGDSITITEANIV